MLLTVVSLALLASQVHDEPTASQLKTASISSMQTSLEMAQQEKIQIQNQSNWNSLYSLIAGGGLMLIVKAAIEFMKGRQALVIAKDDNDLAIEVKRNKLSSDRDNAVILSLRGEIDRLSKECESLRDRLDREEKLTSRMREEMFNQYVYGDEPAFAIISVNTEDKIVYVSKAFERLVLDRLLMKKSAVMDKTYQEAFPSEMYQQIADLRKAAFESPEHTAWHDDFKLPGMPEQFVVCKSLQRSHDTTIGLSMVFFSAKNRVAA